MYTVPVAHCFNDKCCFAVVLHSNKLRSDPLPLQFWGLLFSPASNSLRFDFRLWCQKVSGITGSRNKTPEKYLPQNYLQKLLWKTANQEGICHPRRQFFRYFSNRYSSHRCAKTSISGNIFFRYYTPLLLFASASFSYSHTMRNFPTLETRQSPLG